MIERNQEEYNYLNLLKAILERGSEKKDRTGVGTKSLFGTRLKFNLGNGKIPMLTSKRIFARGVVEELLFFIRGETDTKLLEAKGVNIWRGNTHKEFLARRGLTEYPEGLMGPMYGYNWRNFGGSYSTNHPFPNGGYGLKDGIYYSKDGIDQLKNCFELIKREPDSRRILVSAYDPQASSKSVLDPCHMFFQFYVDKDKLSCQYYQRSVDCFLGLPFNILSYSILTCLMAKATGLKPGELIFVGGDTHIYLNHLDQVKEQISREPYDFPTLNIKKELNSIEDMEKLSFEDFELIGYNHHPKLAGTMAV